MIIVSALLAAYDILALPSQEELALIWSLLVTTVVATFFIQRYKITYIPPSAAAMALGMVYGGIAKLAGYYCQPAITLRYYFDCSSMHARSPPRNQMRLITSFAYAGLTATLRFSPAAFFYGLLPPIVFAAGFTLKKREFFRNFGTIVLFAVVGTLVSTILFGLATYLLMLMHIVKRSHLGTAPLVECMLYGEQHVPLVHKSIRLKRILALVSCTRSHP